MKALSRQAGKALTVRCTQAEVTVHWCGFGCRHEEGCFPEGDVSLDSLSRAGVTLDGRTRSGLSAPKSDLYGFLAYFMSELCGAKRRTKRAYGVKTGRGRNENFTGRACHWEE